MKLRPSVRSNSANTESLECAKMEAGGIRTSQSHKFEGGQIV